MYCTVLSRQWVILTYKESRARDKLFSIATMKPRQHDWTSLFFFFKYVYYWGWDSTKLLEMRYLYIYIYLLLVMRLSNIWYTLYSTVLLKIGYKILPILLQGMRFIFNILGLRFIRICYSTADDLFFYKGDHPFLLLWLVFLYWGLHSSVNIADIHPFIYWGMGCDSFIYVTGDDIHQFPLLLIESSITVI